MIKKLIEAPRKELKGKMGVRALIISEENARGIFVRGDTIPEGKKEEVAREIIGMDYLKVMGLGGCSQQYNNVVFIWKRDNESIDYEVARIIDGRLYWDKYDGNLTASVGIFAIKEGLVSSNEFLVRHVSSNKYTLLRIEGDRVIETWKEELKNILPTKKPIDDILVRNRYVRVSVINSIMPTVIVRARDLDLEGYEMPNEDLGESLALLEELKLKVEKLLHKEPIIITVANPRDYITLDGKEIKYLQFDLSVREYSAKRVNEHLSLSSGLGVAFSSIIPNSLSNLLLRPSGSLRLAHPLGVVKFEVVNKDGLLIASVERKAKVIMEGNLEGV